MAKSDRIEGIDALRGLAALAVVLYHYVGFIPLMEIPVDLIGASVVALTRHGHLGVTIFFVLSGYVIAMTASRYPFTPAIGARFLFRRLVRIAPPYWAMIGLIAATVVAGHGVGLFRNTTITSGQVVAHLAYTQNVLDFPPLDIAYWTLCLEVQFYLVFVAVAVALGRCSVGFRSACFAALTLGSVLIDVFDVVPQAWFPRLWYQFGVGVLAFYADRDRPGRWALILFLPALIGLGIYRSEAVDPTVALVAGLLYYSSRPSSFAPACPKILLGLGGISYSLYLVHGFIGFGLNVAFRSPALRSATAAWVAIAFGVAASIAFAAVFHRLCERRGIEWSRLVRVAPAEGLPPGLAEIPPGQARQRSTAAQPSPTAELGR